MKDEGKTKEQLLKELKTLKERLTKLERAEIEHKRAEEQTVRQSAVLDAINKVFRETLRCETDEEVARICLAVAEELTDSKFGWIGEVNESGRFDTIALSDPGWEACRMPKSDAVRMVKNMEVRGIWGRVLQDERSLIINDSASHPDRVGIPEGHPPLTSFLGVPLNRGGKTIGMIALANKDGGYNLADQEDIEALSVAFLEALIRKRAEEALRESEEKFRGLAEESLVGVYLIQDEIFRYVNPKLAEIFGYTVEELIDKKGPKHLVFPEDRPIVKENLRKRISGEIGSIRYDFRGLTKDKKSICVEVHGTRTVYQGEPAVIGTLLDVTERKEAEKKIIELKEFNEKIVQNMNEGVIVEDTEGLTTYLNPMAEQTLGYTKDELIGQHWSKIVSRRFMRKVEKETSKRSEGITSRYECEMVTKSGDIVPIINSATPLFEEGEFKGVLSVFTDISEQKEKEEKLKKRLMKYRTDWGRVYYADELKLKMALDAFMDLLNLGYPGAVLARLPPDELKDTIQGKAPVLWLSEKAHKLSVAPKFSVLVDKIEDLLTTKKVMLLQGLEYLISKHGYDKTLLFLQELNELFYVENAVLLLSFDSKTLSKQQSGLLKKEAHRLVLKREAEMPEKYFSLLRFVYEKNSAGVNPSQKDVCEHFEITRNTTRARIKYLAAQGLLAEKLKGRSKVLELTELGKDYL